MIRNESLERVCQQLTERNLGAALAEMEVFVAAYPRESNADRLQAVRADFQMMTDYWKRGFKDPQLPALYQSLLQRLYTLYVQQAQAYAIGKSSYLSSVYMRVHIAARDWSPLNIREEMEAFVASLAVLELEPEHQREQKRRELYRRHQQTMNVLFDHIWVAGVWTDGMATAMEEILLSPTIDANDQQLLLSSVMLAVLNHFDMAKFRTLVHVYQQATDERVRQRALVGWVLTADSRLGASVYPEMRQLVGQVLEDERCCQELLELQKQIVFCINAEKDNQTIQQEIMPDLLRNQSWRVTRDGIEEVEEDPMEDILHPDEQERKIEQVEESFRRMVDMQKQGSDIYFGGFSQMKRFPFFNELCNWFVPFFMDHPDIAQVADKFKDNRFLTAMVGKGPFCNSDKYSFVYAFQQVLDRIPKSVHEMLNQGEAQINEMSEEEMNTPAYIRRLYLQDIYRFFRLYPQRAEFENPFDAQTARYLFCANGLFSKTHLEPYFNEVVAFLIKQKRMREAGRVLENYGEARRDFRFYMLAGFLLQRQYHVLEDEGLTAVACFGKALELEPDNERALLGYARALFFEERFEESLEAYDKLLKIHPERRSYLLNRAICLTSLSRYGQALKDLYQLNYESEDDMDVNRVLAWTLTCDGKYEQAEKMYNRLLRAQEKAQADDLLNYGYCLWFSGHVDEAADCFNSFLKEAEVEPRYIIENEWKLLQEKGITEAEQQMMLYIL